MHPDRAEAAAQASDQALREAFSAVRQRHPADVASRQGGGRGIHRFRGCQTALK